LRGLSWLNGKHREKTGPNKVHFKKKGVDQGHGGP